MSADNIKTAGRNVKIELIRIIACYIVVMYHIRDMAFKSNGELSETVVFFECICTICVVTFFMLTGFFIYNKKGNIIADWLKLLKGFFKQIFIPFLLISIITIIFHDYFISKDTFVSCMRNISLIKIVNDLYMSLRYFRAEYLPGTAAHLWYIFSYFLIILFYPLTRLFLTKLPKLVVYTFLVILGILLIANDYLIFYGNPTLNFIFDIIKKPIYYSAVGHVVYNDILKKKIDNIKSDSYIINLPFFCFSILFYIISFISLFITQKNYYLGENGQYVYTSWLSIFSLLLTTCYIFIVYNLNFDKIIVRDTMKEKILFFSSKTFGIYLVHYLISTKLNSIGFRDFFANLCFIILII